MKNKEKKLYGILGLLVVLLTTSIAYYPGMSGGFYFDDKPNLLDVQALHWTELSQDNLQRSLNEVVLPSRPLANLSMAFNHLFSGLDPAPYHWTNLVIHLMTGIVLFWVIRLFQYRHLKEQNQTSGQALWLALFAIALFLLHPLNIQAVTYMVQRMTSMATLFFLLGFGCYLKARFAVGLSARLVWSSLLLLSFTMSVFSKEIGLLLLPLILLYEFCFHPLWWRERFTKMEKLLGKGPLIIFLVLLAVILVAGFWSKMGSNIYWFAQMPTRDYSGYERLLTQGRIQFFYLSLFLLPLPSRLNLDHHFTLSHSLLEPFSTLIAFLLILLVITVAFKNAWRKPLLAFPVLGYLLLHAIESAPINLELVFEHRMYQPMTMLCLLIAVAGTSFIGRFSKVKTGVAVSILLVLAIFNFQRNIVWGEPMTFLRDVAMKSPEKFRPQFNLGTRLGKLGLYSEAIPLLERAIVLKPENSQVHNQLGNIYLLTGDQAAAERQYLRSVELEQTHAEALYNLAMIYASQHRYKEQRQMLERFVEHAPPYLQSQKVWAMGVLKH